MAGGFFKIEREEDTIVVVPTLDLRELEYQRIEEGAKTILELLDSTTIKNVVLDFHMTDYFGSTALGLFLKFWKRIIGKNGRMAFCNLSDHEKEILQVMKLDHFWPIYSSRSQALGAVRE
jgi:anti-anti-sigma factor